MIAEYFADWLDQKATITARAPSKGGFADTTPTWSLIVADELPCKVRPLRAESLALQNRDTSKVWARIYFATDPGVTAEHRVTVDGKHFSLVTTLDVMSEGDLFYVDCIEIRG